jgi:hypothetical protein
MNDDDIENLEDLLLLCPPPEADEAIVAYFSVCSKHPDVKLLDFGNSFMAVYAKRVAVGKTPAEAIKNCLLLTDLLG